MTRKTAREFAAGVVYALGGGTATEELVEERLSTDFFQRLSGEDELFSAEPGEVQRQYIKKIVSGVWLHMAELDGYIEEYAVGWRFERLPRMAVALMRVCMYEILYMPDIPDNAAISEAVEISKKYEPAEVTSYMNGILGSFLRAQSDSERAGGTDE